MIAMRKADPVQSALAGNEEHSADGSPGTYLQYINRRENITGVIHLREGIPALQTHVEAPGFYHCR